MCRIFHRKTEDKCPRLKKGMVIIMSCCICKKNVEQECAPILMMSAYGIPRYICPECESAIDKAMESLDPETINDSCRKLGESLTAGNTDDTAVIDEVNKIIFDAKSRCKKIKDGTYSEDENSENGKDSDAVKNEEEFELTEDLLETEEDRAKDEHDAKVAKIVDTAVSWAAGIMIVAAIVFFIIKFVI